MNVTVLQCQNNLIAGTFFRLYITESELHPSLSSKVKVPTSNK
jgi:hypothetical protein